MAKTMLHFLLFSIFGLYQVRHMYAEVINIRRSNMKVQNGVLRLPLNEEEVVNGISIQFDFTMKDCHGNCDDTVINFDAVSSSSNVNTIPCFNRTDHTGFTNYIVTSDECRNKDPRICSGSREFYLKVKKFWVVHIGHRCQDMVKNKGQNEFLIDINITFETGLSPRCVKFDFNRCPLNNSGIAFPNVLGFDNQGSTIEAGRHFELIKVTDKCYTHIDKFLCMTLYPRCDLPDRNADIQKDKASNSINKTQQSKVPGQGSGSTDKYLTPCKQMCYDVLFACSQNSTIIESVFNCENYPDKDCYYEEVICGPLPEFQNSSIHGYNGNNKMNTSVLYVCNDGLEPKELESKSTCQASGTWSLDTFTCVTKVKNKSSLGVVIITVPILLIVLLIAITALVLHRYRRECHLILETHSSLYRMLRRMCPHNENVERKIIFLSFSSEDMDIATKFKQEFNEKIPECVLGTYQEDFLYGERIADCVSKSVWKSDSVILMVSQNYVNSEWCLYEFRETDRRRKTENSFRVVLLLAEDVNDTSRLTDVPNDLKFFLQNHIYLWLRQDEEVFWSRLRDGIL